MGKYLSFGKYNNLYKYIWIYLIINTIFDYLFDNNFPNQLKFNIFENNNYPQGILIYWLFYYIGSFILSILLYLYVKSLTKENQIKNDDVMHPFLKMLEKNRLIYQKEQSFFYILKKSFPTSFYSILSNQLNNTFLYIGFIGLDCWVFNLFFMAFVNYLNFKIPIFGHKKFAIGLILIFSTLLFIGKTYIYLFDDSFNLIYKNHIEFIPLGFISYILICFLRMYSICSIKWLLDYKYIPTTIFLIIYNFIGIFMLLIPSLILSSKKCVDKSIFDNIDFICKIKIVKNNLIEYYYDNFSYFFSKLWRADKTIGINILYIILFIIRIILVFITTVIRILLIEHLNPEFYICAYEMYFLIKYIFSFIDAILSEGSILLEVFHVLCNIFSVLGIMIYLELIELKFSLLDYFLKRNIERRSLIDYRLCSVDNLDDFGYSLGKDEDSESYLYEYSIQVN